MWFHTGPSESRSPRKTTTCNFLFLKDFCFLSSSGGEAEAAALHADFQAVGRLTAGVDDTTVHVTGEVTVPALLSGAAAAEARVISRARAAGGTVQHDVTEGQELTEEAGQDAVHTAVILGLRGDL